MSVLISGALIDGAGIPMSGCHIILKSRVNTSEVVMRTVADVVTGNNGEYSFEAQTGKYSVYLKQDWRDEYCVGDISVYDDSKPGTLNDFLTAIDEGDLKPDVVKRFEELVAQAQQSAKSAAESAQESGKHAADAERAKEDSQNLADETQQNAHAVAENKAHVEQLASEVALNAGQVQQGVQDAGEAVRAAQQAAEESASSAAESKASAEYSAQCEQNAQQHAQNAEQNAQKTSEDRKATTTARADAEQFAADSRQNADATAQDRIATAENARQSQLNAQTSEQSAQEAKSYRDSAQQIVDGLNATNATTTQKGLVQLSSATDSDSEELAATPKAVKIVMDETNTKAPLDSPALVGEPTAPTPDLNAKGREIATAAFVRALIAALVGSSPEALDTLNELAAALGNDPEFATTITNALAGKQPLNDTLTSLSGLVTADNKLPYFSDKNVMALANLTAVGRGLIGQNSKNEVLDYLGVKSAAMKEVQSDIYDRTEGRVALPGAFGYGSIFTSSRSFSSVDGPSEFLSWVTETPPGKYSVYQSGGTNYNPILNIDGKQINFSGVVEIVIPDFLSINENQTEKDKLVTFYGVNGEIYTNRLYAGAFCGWENLKLEIKDVTNALRTTTGNLWGSPGVGGLIMAAYCGESDDDNNRKLIRGNIVPGSRLGMITLSGSYSTTGTYVSTPRLFVVTPNIYPQAGTFIALSGNTMNTGDKTTALVGLFVRIA